MTLTWDYPARATWLELEPDDVYAVSRAAVRFAELGEGEVRWRPPYFWLRAGRHDLMLSIDYRAGTICVLRIYRAPR